MRTTLMCRCKKLLACGVLPGVIFLYGCSTPYSSQVGLGGYSQTSGPGKLQEVVFVGNGYTSSELAQQYVLFRCAEIAKQQRKPFFLIYDSLSSAAADKRGTEPRVGRNQHYPKAYAFILPIDEQRSGALDTEAILSMLRPVVDRNIFSKAARDN